MNERITKLVEKTIVGKMYPTPIKTEYDRCDLLLSPVKMSCKRVCEYILNQEPIITEQSKLTGLLIFDGSVEGDVFHRAGHKNFGTYVEFYNKPIDNLTVFEWQHSVADFSKVINNGITGIQKAIEKSKENHKNDKAATEFLETQEDFCETVIKWAEKCSKRVEEFSQNVSNINYKDNLIKLSESLKKVPKYPATSFYEAVLSLTICFSFVPDSIGLVDRYLYPYYKNDIEKGILTNEEASEYLQELYLIIQSQTHPNSDRFYRGGESHFCIGGYLENGEDGFNELSMLALDSLIELPTWIPQISLRWNKKTPHEVLYHAMDCERKDPNKRIAFVNDEPRIKGFTTFSDLSYKEACNYSMAGCNEPALPGGMMLGIDTSNVARSIENTFFKRSDDIKNAKNYEEFYKIYEEELFKDLYQMEKIEEGFQSIRERDCNIVSNIFFNGCIENAKSISQRGLSKYIAVGTLIGITTVIDSLLVVKQFVFEEKRITMEQLTQALHNNWQGYEELRAIILKKAKFFGNNEELSDEIARSFFASLEKWNNHENYLGKKYVFGNLVGYNEHHKFFGSKTKATPNGRFDGDMISFGIGQSEGKDRKGISALLSSIAQCDPHGILTGPSVTNVMLDEQLVKNDETFEKLVYLFEAYFKMGGTHFQLTYVSKEDLINAKKTPEKYGNLRVRVSGFSDYFVNLNDGLQDEIIERTVIKK